MPNERREKRLREERSNEGRRQMITESDVVVDEGRSRGKADDK